MFRLLLLSGLLLITNCVAEKGWVLNTESDEPYVSVWEVKSGKEIKLPLPEGFNYNFIVDWGDGSQSEITSADDPSRQHVYTKTGLYTVRISGLVEAWGYSSHSGYRCTITSVPELGDVGWKSLRYAFTECRKLTNVRGGDVSQVTDMSKAFLGSYSVKPEVSEWDTAKVTDMYLMFGRTRANPDVSAWDVSNVTDMTKMFFQAYKATPKVSEWDVSNVTDMRGMFEYAYTADPDVSEWDVSNVTDMSDMFRNAYAADPDVSKWNTTNVIDMKGMFADARVAVPDMSRWDFSKVSCYANLFDHATLPTTTYSNFLLQIAATSDKRGDELCGEICLRYESDEWPEKDRICRVWKEPFFPLTAGQSKYNAEAAVARQTLIDRGWKIEDGGQE